MASSDQEPRWGNLSGEYATTITVHNFHPVEIPYSMKYVSNGFYWEPDHPSSGVSIVYDPKLPPNRAMRIGCLEIRSALQAEGSADFLGGFVEFVTDLPLSVTAAYTGKSCNARNRHDCQRELTLDVVPQAPYEIEKTGPGSKDGHDQ